MLLRNAREAPLKLFLPVVLRGVLVSLFIVVSVTSSAPRGPNVFAVHRYFLRYTTSKSSKRIFENAL